VNPKIHGALVRLLTQALGAIEPALAARSLTAAHVGALPTFLSLLPVSDLVALATGNGAVNNVLDVAEAGAALVARAFPPAAITAEEVKLGLEALQFLLDVAGLGPSPFKLQPGYRPITGGFAGARGHI
jgi:hypothetical protein